MSILPSNLQRLLTVCLFMRLSMQCLCLQFLKECFGISCGTKPRNLRAITIKEAHQIVQIRHVAIVSEERKLSLLSDLEQVLDTGLQCGQRQVSKSWCT
jgi:hypothetical protein